jgi:hypothetical protein
VQVGAEDKKKLIIAVILMGVAILAIGKFLFFPAGPEPPAPSSASSATTPRSKPGGKKPVLMARSLDPELRYDWLQASEDTKYQGNGRNIFRAQEIAIPTPIAKPTKTPPPPPPVDNTPPPPPPINLKFFGFANRPGEAKKVFLEQGEDIFVASEGDIVNRRYKVVKIGVTSVEVEDVLNNNRQSIPLTQG